MRALDDVSLSQATDQAHPPPFSPPRRWGLGGRCCPGDLIQAAPTLDEVAMYVSIASIVLSRMSFGDYMDDAVLIVCCPVSAVCREASVHSWHLDALLEVV